MARLSASFAGSSALSSGSSGHDPPAAEDRASPKGREAREVGRTGEEVEVGANAERSAYAGASSAVPAPHQVGQLPFDLRPRLAVVVPPFRIGLFGAGACKGGLVHPDPDLAAEP